MGHVDRGDAMGIYRQTLLALFLGHFLLPRGLVAAFVQRRSGQEIALICLRLDC